MGYSPRALTRMYKPIGKHFSSLARGGVYALKSGYHSSFNDNERRWPRNYSTLCPADRDCKRNAAAAIDLTFRSPAEMRKATERLIDACKRNDPRIACVREVIGTLDSRNVITYNRVATGNGSRSRTGVLWGVSDSSHLWHVHISFLRRFATRKNEALGVVEVVCGLKPGTLTGEKHTKAVPTGDRKRHRVRITEGDRAGGWFWGTDYLNVDRINKARTGDGKHGRFARDVWYLQKWLVELGYGEANEADGGKSHRVEVTGYWNGKTQDAYDAFRRSVGYSGDDARGSVGPASLRKLQEAAEAASVKHIK